MPGRAADSGAILHTYESDQPFPAILVGHLSRAAWPIALKVWRMM
jgi:hypothetical protein